jgi:hypothetical protein
MFLAWQDTRDHVYFTVAFNFLEEAGSRARNLAKREPRVSGCHTMLLGKGITYAQPSHLFPRLALADCNPFGAVGFIEWLGHSRVRAWFVRCADDRQAYAH